MEILCNRLWRTLNTNDLHPFHQNHTQMLEERKDTPRRAFHIDIWRNEQEIHVFQPPCCSQIRRISREMVCSIHKKIIRWRWRTHIRHFLGCTDSFYGKYVTGLCEDASSENSWFLIEMTGADCFIFLEQLLKDLLTYAHNSTSHNNS